jgi:hypothetical protein
MRMNDEFFLIDLVDVLILFLYHFMDLYFQEYLNVNEDVLIVISLYSFAFF